MTDQLLLLEPAEATLRLSELQKLLQRAGTEAVLISDNANLFRYTGRVFTGYAYIPAEGKPLWLVRRPNNLSGDEVHYIHRPEDIPTVLQTAHIEQPRNLGLELDILPFNQARRIENIFAGIKISDATGLLREARSVKTPLEIKLMEISGEKHTDVYRRIPGLYCEGMTDHELQVEIERIARLKGCLGVFRISGQSMELFMGNILSGSNADNPTPYDFAMGGSGLHPSLPVGANGETILKGTTVMVDLNGDYTGYMTDMTRVFSLGTIPQLAIDAHECSRRICRMFEREALPGVEAKDLYFHALDIVKSHSLEPYFMGHRQHAGFIGHGLGIEINELPVIAPRSRHILKADNMIALEPKFVIPGTGAVGIENTYHITPQGARNITTAPEEITPLI